MQGAQRSGIFQVSPIIFKQGEDCCRRGIFYFSCPMRFDTRKPLFVFGVICVGVSIAVVHSSHRGVVSVADVLPASYGWSEAVAIAGAHAKDSVSHETAGAQHGSFMSFLSAEELKVYHSRAKATASEIFYGRVNPRFLR